MRLSELKKQLANANFSNVHSFEFSEGKLLKSNKSGEEILKDSILHTEEIILKIKGKKVVPAESIFNINYGLKDIFINSESFNNISNLLTERKFVDPKSFEWIDFKKGYKQVLFASIKNLQSKGYFKMNVTNEQIITILKNTFKIDVNISTVKKANDQTANFDYIPYLKKLE